MEMQNLYSEALVLYEKVLTISPRHTMARIRAAQITHEKARDPTLAQQLLTGVLRDTPMSHPAWFQLGVVLAGVPGQELRAAECFERAIQLDKSSPVLPYELKRRLPTIREVEVVAVVKVANSHKWPISDPFVQSDGEFSLNVKQLYLQFGFTIL